VAARRLPPARRLRPAERALLAAEILTAWLRARRELRRAPIAAVVAALRAESPPAQREPGARAESPADRGGPDTPTQSPADQGGPDTPTQSPGELGGPGAPTEAVRLGRAVARTLRLVPGDTRCLARSLVLTTLLARRGIQAKLVIGARPEPDFRAHAWVECAGHAVLPPGDGAYGRLVEL
jgi:hypothetical protein